jgi:hypothetical protein
VFSGASRSSLRFRDSRQSAWFSASGYSIPIYGGVLTVLGFEIERMVTGNFKHVDGVQLRTAIVAKRI